MRRKCTETLHLTRIQRNCFACRIATTQFGRQLHLAEWQLVFPCTRKPARQISPEGLREGTSQKIGKKFALRDARRHKRANKLATLGRNCPQSCADRNRAGPQLLLATGTLTVTVTCDVESSMMGGVTLTVAF